MVFLAKSSGGGQLPSDNGRFYAFQSEAKKVPLPSQTDCMKQILIFALIIYLISKLSGFFRVSSTTQHQKNTQHRKPEGSIHVDSVPKKERRGDIKGGDYVDYEEVK